MSPYLRQDWTFYSYKFCVGGDMELIMPVNDAHLENHWGYFYGMIGGFTRIRDSRNKLLKVGDTVTAYHISGSVLEETPVTFQNDGTAYGSYPSIYGISQTCSEDGGIFGGWSITKKRGYEEIEDGEIINPDPNKDQNLEIVYYCGH
jgi:hypothetical protein